MQIGMIGLGRMGGNIVRRLMQHGHEAVVYDRDAKAKDGEQSPVYAMSFELFENGVSRALVLDYNDFVISGALGKFDVKDSRPCKE